MISLTTADDLSQHRRGRAPSYEPLSPAQAKVEAYKLLQRGLTPLEARIIDLLSASGVLPTYRLSVNKNTVTKFLKSRLLDRLPFASGDVTAVFQEYGIPVQEGDAPSLYTLGPVGAEIAAERHAVTPPMGFLAYPLERVMHDVVVNECLFLWAEQAKEHGWDLLWRSKYESTLYRDGTPILEPDALFVLRKGENEISFALEYHNEARRTRSVSKVRRYEMACSDTDLWMKTWDVETFPAVLAVYRKRVVGKGYVEGVAEYEGRGKCTFYGRSLAAVLNAEPDWYNFATRKKETVFPWDGEAA